MTVEEFKILRDLHDKSIEGDLVFACEANPDIYQCSLPVRNSLNFEVILNATYNDKIPSVKFNFRVVGNGAICRYCINSKPHPDANTGILTRTHKHSPRRDSDFRATSNLPYAVSRSFTILGFADVDTIWRTICKEANIEFDGSIVKR